MKAIVRWRNPNGKGKISDVDMVVAILFTVLYPFLVLVVWALPIWRHKEVFPVYMPFVFVFKETVKIWKETLE